MRQSCRPAAGRWCRAPALPSRADSRGSCEGNAFVALVALVDRREVGVERGEVVDAGGEALLGATIQASNHVRHVVAGEIGVGAVVVIAAGGRRGSIGI